MGWARNPLFVKSGPRERYPIRRQFPCAGTKNRLACWMEPSGYLRNYNFNITYRILNGSSSETQTRRLASPRPAPLLTYRRQTSRIRRGLPRAHTHTHTRTGGWLPDNAKRLMRCSFITWYIVFRWQPSEQKIEKCQSCFNVTLFNSEKKNSAINHHTGCVIWTVS